MPRRPDQPADDSSELTPEQESEVRRRLADARHTEPLPVDVAQRLDEVLARLTAGDPVAGPVSIEHGAEVVALAAKRRRSAVSLLVAAAAVVVIGVGLGQVIDTTPRSQSDSSEVAASAQTTEAGEAGGAAQDGADLTTGSLSAEMAEGKRLASVLTVGGRLGRVSEAGFADDAARIRDRVGVTDAPMSTYAVPPGAPTPDLQSGGAASETTEARRDASSLKAWSGCLPADWGDGLLVAVTYGGTPAVLAFREPAGETQVVDLLQCGTGAVLRSITLPTA